MQERDHRCEKLLQEVSPFPLIEGIVKRSLEDIAKDPYSEFKKNLKDLESEDPNTFRLITALFRKNKGNIGTIEGGVFAYKIIKDSACNKNSKLPILKNNLGDFFISNFYRENEEVDDLVERRTNEIKIDDPFFIEAIQQMSQYRIDSKRFFYGAVVVYSAIKYSEKYQ